MPIWKRVERCMGAPGYKVELTISHGGHRLWHGEDML